MTIPRPRRALRRSAALVGGLLLIGFWQSALAQQQGSRSFRGAEVSATAMTAGMIALGDSIFHGKAAGGACLMCHGADAKGTPGLAPNLTGRKWLHGDGSYAFIVHTVENGVPDPKAGSMPMPPMGGAKLTPEQVRAVAAYIYSLSHPELRRSASNGSGRDSIAPQ